MKNILSTTFLLAFAFFGPLHGQFHLNVSAGANNTNAPYNKKELTGHYKRWGYFLSVGPSYQVGKKIKVLLDCQYSQKGFAIVKGSVQDYNYRSTYLDLLPEVEYDLFSFLSFGLGMNYGFLLEGELSVPNNLFGDLDLTKSFDMGVTGKVKLSYKNLFGFARLNQGLTNISALPIYDINGEELKNVKQINQNLQLGIGYTLRL